VDDGDLRHSVTAREKPGSFHVDNGKSGFHNSPKKVYRGRP
jgi:hypothetical protein